jgi:hypothetical protein
MKLSQQISNRFRELELLAAQLPIEGEGYDKSVGDHEAFQTWASSAMHLVSAVFGDDSPHYRNLSLTYSKFNGWARDFFDMRGIFLAAKSDYDGGYLFKLEATVSGEIYADFVVLAKNALDNNQKDVAAVLACAALEDALKRYASLRELNVDGKVMQEVINALKAKGLVAGPQKSLLDSMPKVRDAAMHADWPKITPQDVGSVIGFVQQFLLTQF